MDDVAANPIIIAFMFLLRCLVPLLIMLGVSYLLRRLGWIKEPPAPPRESDNGGTPNGNTEEGGLEND
jgi:hypothetical protein